MPYTGEFANKSSHFDIIRNPEVQAFLEECEFIKQPSEAEGKAIGAKFAVPPTYDDITLPERVIATDGSPYESSWNDHLPSSKIGYVKVGTILIDLEEFGDLRVHNGRMVDPFRVAALRDRNDALTFILPSANVRYSGTSSVRDSFRKSVDRHLYNEKTRFVKDDPKTSLRTTLFHLAALRTGDYHGEPMGTNDPTRLKIHKCPTCGEGPIEVEDIPDPQYCRHCKAAVYPSDCLRLWEEVSDYQSNRMAITRFMNLVEHLLLVHYIRHVAKNSLASLATLAFFVDGPLALYGTAAWLHGCIMRYLHDINVRLRESGYERVLIIGLQKSGAVIDHVQFVEQFIKPNRIFALNDEYRYQYVITGRGEAGNGFGYETYYGQDFIFKTPSGRYFVFALPYPFASKHPAGIPFPTAKADVSRYPELARALALIHHFESDLYENALIPIALAHRYTAISLEPGGRVLDLITKQALAQKI